jgi:hypothetical protein
MRDLPRNVKRWVILGCVLAELIAAANYFLDLGLFAHNAKETMVVGFVVTVLVALYYGPTPDDRDGVAKD